jgi:hypothetical protein
MGPMVDRHEGLLPCSAQCLPNGECACGNHLLNSLCICTIKCDQLVSGSPMLMLPSPVPSFSTHHVVYIALLSFLLTNVAGRALSC